MFDQLRHRLAERRGQREADAAGQAVARAEETYQQALARWDRRHEEAAHLLDVAQTFTGTSTDELMLKEGEALFAKVTNASLLGEHTAVGHWEGRSSGVSIPIRSLGGRSVRYRVGAARGHYVQGAPVTAAVDAGTFFITNQRAVFLGAKRTSECSFAKLVAYRHDDAAGTTTLSVSNREKPTVVAYGADIAGWVDFRLDLALAHFRGEVATMVQGLQRDLDEVMASKPAPPSGDAPVAPAAPTLPATPPAASATKPEAPPAPPSAASQRSGAPLPPSTR